MILDKRTNSKAKLVDQLNGVNIITIELTKKVNLSAWILLRPRGRINN